MVKTINLLSKEEAKERGLNYYFTAKPCKNGHIAKRRLTGHCYDCHYKSKLNSNKNYYRNNILKIKNKVKSVEFKLKRNQKLRDSGYGKFISNKRRAQLIKAIPKWADLEKIKIFYANCPKGYEVDHIIPLINKRVCGLHSLENLQYLTIAENRAKSNRLDFYRNL